MMTIFFIALVWATGVPIFYGIYTKLNYCRHSDGDRWAISYAWPISSFCNFIQFAIGDFLCSLGEFLADPLKRGNFWADLKNLVSRIISYSPTSNKIFRPTEFIRK